MIRLVHSDGSLTDPTPVKPTDFYSVDARRAARMKFLSDVGLTLDDRLLSDDVQDIIDTVLFNQVADKAA